MANDGQRAIVEQSGTCDRLSSMFSSDKKKVDEFAYQGEDLEAMMQADHYYRWLIKAMSPYIGKNIVEVGSGVGSFSKLLKELSPKTLDLIEPSKKTFLSLKENIKSTKKTKVTTHNSYLKGVEKELKNKADTYIYINVFEHIEDDFAEAKRVAEMLKPGGNLIIFVPALNALYSNFDKSIGHYRRYDKQRLIKISEDAGLEVKQVRYMDMAGIVPWWVSFVAMKRKGLVGPLVKIYDSICIPIISKAEDILHVPIGKNALLIASKPKHK